MVNCTRNLVNGGGAEKLYDGRVPTRHSKVSRVRGLPRDDYCRLNIRSHVRSGWGSGLITGLKYFVLMHNRKFLEQSCAHKIIYIASSIILSIIIAFVTQ